MWWFVGFLFIPEGYYSEHRILGPQSFKYLETLSYFVLASLVSYEKPAAIPNLVFDREGVVSLLLLSEYFLFWVFRGLIYVDIGLDFFGFIQFGD